MVPIALVLLIVTLIFTVRERAWLYGLLAVVTGVFLAGTPWGMRVIQFCNMCLNWVTSLFNG